jgi:dienelactone hydrolase
LLPGAAVALFFAAAIPTGTIVDEVQGYALYLPSTYSPERAWPVIFAFDPRARGRTPVERYQAAAEKYGYIVAGSNVSRNGSWEVSMNAAQAMVADVSGRFHVDAKRVYAAGMSGGARVAMGIALGSNLMAGVIASSAGYPDSKPRKTVPFAVFGTAGTEDFNYLEMRELDRTLTSPHRVAIFAGGHVWLSSELAMQAVEWMELQAMASGRAARNAGWIDRLYAARLAAAESSSGAQAVRALDAIAADFREFKDVSAIADRAATMRKDRAVRQAFKHEQAEERDEQHKLAGIFTLERQLADREAHSLALSQLREEWKRLRADASAATDSSSRRVARRLTRSLAMSANERTNDPEYRKILSEFGRRPTTP